jgi:putative transposase
VGRIIKKLKERGVLKEPLPNHMSARKSQRQRPYTVTKPEDYQVEEPGDIAELDTPDVRPLPGIAAALMGTPLRRMPFPIKVIQVDAGAEFQDSFEAECQRRDIKLFVLPPRSPKINGHVQRAQSTHAEEFCEVTDTGFEIAELNQSLLDWEKVYSTVSPHQALGYLTPKEFPMLHQQNRRRGKMSPIT